MGRINVLDNFKLNNCVFYMNWNWSQLSLASLNGDLLRREWEMQTDKLWANFSFLMQKKELWHLPSKVRVYCFLQLKVLGWRIWLKANICIHCIKWHITFILSLNQFKCFLLRSVRIPKICIFYMRESITRKSMLHMSRSLYLCHEFALISNFILQGCFIVCYFL